MGTPDNIKDLHELFRKYRDNTCTKEEFKTLMAYLKENKNDHQVKAWMDEWLKVPAKKENQEDDVAMENALDTVLQRIRKQDRKKPLKTRNLSIYAVRLATAVALILGVGWAVIMTVSSPHDMTQVTKATKRGQRASITLSDGSIIKLNAESAITFAEKFDGDTREVSLTGEAFFEVKSNPEKPFIVKTGEISTTVLGTSFNIQAYPLEEEIAVTVATGKVLVEAHHPDSMTGSQARTLTPDDQLTYHALTKTMMTQTVDTDHYLAWKNDEIRLDKTTLAEAAVILERWYDVKIIFENEALKDCLISGRYNSDKLTNILESIRYIKGISYRLEKDGKVMLNGAPCK